MEENSEVKIPCPNCKNPVDKLVFYCPICGKKIREKPVGTGFWPILGLVALSMLLPPLNLPLSIKYIRAAEPKAKQMGWISLVLMAVSLTIMIWWSVRWAQEVNRQVELEMSKYLGF
jgi:hypothetical protein